VEELWACEIINVQHQNAKEREPPKNIKAGNAVGSLNRSDGLWRSSELFF
jgi:hypothetical protein